MKKIIALVIAVILVSVIYTSSAPSTFPTKPFIFSIANGSSLTTVSSDLMATGMIRSEFLLKTMVVAISLNKGVQAGDYKFEGKESTFDIAKRLVKGDHRQKRITITIPEGTNVRDMAQIFFKKLPSFDVIDFVKLASPEEGYLYPDTYTFFENVTSEEILKTMRSNFDSKLEKLSDEIASIKRSQADVINMAAILEKESKTELDSKIIAGILWKRLDEGIPLQVDAPFYYLTGKTGPYTLDDLKIKSPYNTYMNKGLPAGPISNPGMVSIKASITPTKTSYYYYLTGKDGKMYYSDTYEGHLSNKAKYLR
jgi:UPF0755 protein